MGNYSLPNTAALIIVDVQKGFEEEKWGERNNPNAEENIAKLLRLWRKTGRPVFHVKHMSVHEDSPLYPNQVGNEIKDIVKPLDGEPIIEKTVNSSFIGTNLESQLRSLDVDTVVVTGLTTNHCVETTTRMAGNLGFKTYIVTDATATFSRIGPDGRKFTADEIHAMTFVNLHEEFATVIDTAGLTNLLENSSYSLN
jgi:nicotinamidase-related amidase